MRICDFLDLCIEPGFCTVVVYDVERAEDLWKGPADEIPAELSELKVESWDIPSEAGVMTFNVAAYVETPLGASAVEWLPGADDDRPGFAKEAANHAEVRKFERRGPLLQRGRKEWQNSICAKGDRKHGYFGPGQAEKAI